MKNLNKAILIALGMALPLGAMASPDDDVTIRMMEVNEHAADAVTSHIELPEAADDHAREHAAKGLETANKNRDRDHDMDREDNHEDRDREMDRDEDHEREMDREEDHERDMDTERDDRKDVEHDGMDREEVEREGLDDIDHAGDNGQPEIDMPGSDGEGSGHDNDPSSHEPQ